MTNNPLRVCFSPCFALFSIFHPFTLLSPPYFDFLYIFIIVIQLCLPQSFYFTHVGASDPQLQFLVETLGGDGEPPWCFCQQPCLVRMLCQGLDPFRRNEFLKKGGLKVECFKLHRVFRRYLPHKQCCSERTAL